MRFKITVLLFCLFFLNGCKFNDDNSEILKSYIISKSKNKKNLHPYYENQLIISKDENLYFYQREESVLVTSCLSSNQDTIPYLLDLKPHDLVKIPKESLEQFVYENFFTVPYRRGYFIIASQNDTIKNKPILTFLKNIRIPYYSIRRTTQEEDTVLKYKINNELYYPKTIKWDKSKIRERLNAPKVSE